MSPAGTERMLAGLVESSHLRTVDDLPALLAAHTPQAGFTQVLIYLSDLQQQHLRLLQGPGAEGEPAELPVEKGSRAGPSRRSAPSAARRPGPPRSAGGSRSSTAPAASACCASAPATPPSTT